MEYNAKPGQQKLVDYNFNNSPYIIFKWNYLKKKTKNTIFPLKKVKDSWGNIVKTSYISKLGRKCTLFFGFLSGIMLISYKLGC